MSVPALPQRLLALVGLIALVAGGCTRARGDVASADPTVTTSTTLLPTTTTVPPTTTSTSTSSTLPPPPPGLARGARGQAVLALEQRLAALHYDTGKVDEVFDAVTTSAVIAFQKVQGLPRTGRATDDVVNALETATPPAPLVPAGGADRVEVDLKRQVLFLYQHGELIRILMVSTGSGKKYCVDGQCAKAVTPGGSFRVTWKMKGIRTSKLGQLWNPLYFNGGIAIHGEPAVPVYPASHGCVRIPMSASMWFYQTVSTGTPVYVVGGAAAPVPFNEQAPVGATSTTTTAAPTTTSSPSSTTTSEPETTTTSTSTTSTTTQQPPVSTP